MDWSTLLSTVVGGLLAAGSGFYAQFWSERRAEARETRQEDAERFAWARTLRWEAHVRFNEMYDFHMRRIQSWREDPGTTGQDVPEDALSPMWAQFTMIRLISEKQTADAAEELLAQLKIYAYEPDPMWQPVEYARDQYIGAVRAEFKLGPIPLMGD